MRVNVRVVLTAAAVAVFLALVLVFTVEPLNWRAMVLWRFADGEISNVTLGELLRMLRPGAGFWLQPVLEGRGFVSVVESPYDSKDGVAAGAKIYHRHCSICHGMDGGGISAPSLKKRTSLRRGSSDLALYRSITDGISGTAMAPAQLSFGETWKVVSFLKSLDADGVLRAPNVSAPGISAKFRSVTSHDLFMAGRDGGDWPMYSRTYNGWRFSPLAQIHRGNVRKLRLHWIRQLANNDSEIEAAPIVVNGEMFITEPPGGVVALDAANGEVLWRYHHEIGSRLALCCGRINRGIAVLGDMVYFGTLDAHLVALNAVTGRVVWDEELASPKEGYSITGAPLAVGDMVVTGVSGGEFGIRGFVHAADARTGKMRWRFYTIPAPGEPGSETWSGNAWRTGGGPTWVTGSFDPELNLIYWGVGNPSPEFDGDARPGDNLYTNSVVALDAATGRLAWHFQFTPHDEHDWDSNQVPVLASIKPGGVEIPVIAWANRNGFYYVLDRRNGQFITGVPFVRQSWAQGLEQSGRPRLAPARVSQAGTLTYPSASGGTNWQSPAFNPKRGLFFVHALEGVAMFTKAASKDVKRRPFEFFAGSGSQIQGKIVSFVRALNVATGERIWEYQSSRGHGKRASGLLATAGDLVFGASAERAFALDVTTGRELWSVSVGAEVSQGPIAYRDNGREVVVFVAGNAVIAFSL